MILEKVFRWDWMRMGLAFFKFINKYKINESILLLK